MKLVNRNGYNSDLNYGITEVVSVVRMRFNDGANKLDRMFCFPEIWEVGVENAEYLGPSPPSETHRYFFLLFQQVLSHNFVPTDVWTLLKCRLIEMH